MTATLFIDMESSGLIKKDRPIGDPSQPWAVSVAVLLVDGKRRDDACFRIRAEEGRKMSPEAEKIHGISLREAQKAGVPELVMLSLVSNFAKDAEVIVSHGTFDRDLMISLLRRRSKPDSVWTHPGLVCHNTADITKPLCRLPFEDPEKAGEWRWPSLDEAGAILLGEAPREGIHDPRDDLCRLERIWNHCIGQNLVEVYS